VDIVLQYQDQDGDDDVVSGVGGGVGKGTLRTVYCVTHVKLGSRDGRVERDSIIKIRILYK
jgi:hypothetical protein